MENRKIRLKTQYRIKLSNSLITNYIHAAQAMSDFGMRAQKTFVSLLCDMNNFAKGIIYHAQGSSRDYSFNLEVALDGILYKKELSQVWFGRSDPDCITGFTSKDFEYYKFFSLNLLKNGKSPRGLSILTPSGNARYFDGMNEIEYEYKPDEDGEIEIPIWEEIFG